MLHKSTGQCTIIDSSHIRMDMIFSSLDVASSPLKTAQYSTIPDDPNP